MAPCYSPRFPRLGATLGIPTHKGHMIQYVNTKFHYVRIKDLFNLRRPKNGLKVSI